MRKSDTIEILEELTVSKSPDVTWRILLAAIQSCGFTQALYAFTRFRTPNGMGNEEDHLVLTNYPKEYLDGFLRTERYKIAPMAEWALNNIGARSWSWVTDNMDLFSDAQKEVLDYNQKYGITAGYTIGFRPTRSHEKAGIGLALAPFAGTQQDADAIWEEHGDALQLLCDVAHLKILSMPLPRKVLTERQTEVLEWIGEGKAVADTAKILGLTSATVEKHLRLARSALDVETTAQAVLKASVYNQIYSVN